MAPAQPSDEIGNSALLVDATKVIVRLALPVLVTLKFCAALGTPTVCLAKAIVAGDRAAAGPGVTAVPVRSMVYGLPLAPV